MIRGKHEAKTQAETPPNQAENPEEHAPPTTQTVEQVVRKQLAQALGGGRGMLEAAVPTIAFTVLFLTVHDLRLAIIVSVGCAGVLLAVRLVQRSTRSSCSTPCSASASARCSRGALPGEAGTRGSRRWRTSCLGCSTTSATQR